MSKVFSFLKQIRLARVVIALFAGAVLFLNTACSPDSPRVSGEGSYNERVSQETELYDPIQEPQGGMNNYADTDPRRNTKATEAKARTLSREAERNIQKVQNPQEFVEDYRSGTPFGERVRNITEGVGEAAENVGEDLTKGSRQGAAKIRDASEEIGRNVNNNVSDSVDSTRRNARQAAEGASNFAQDRARDTAKAAERATDRAVDALDNRA
jgi:hypothetical protein